MKYRISNKQKKKYLLHLLKLSVEKLEEGRTYRVRVVRLPSAELRKVAEVNGYRIEIRSSRESKHNHAHFHVIKGTNGMASIRIDNLEVLHSTLSKKDLAKILEWAGDNRAVLVAVWNEFHGHRVVVE